MRLLKVTETAAELNCSESFVRSLLRSGLLKFHRLGKGQGGIRISDAHLATYLQEREQGGESRPIIAPTKKKALKHLSLD